MAFPRENGVGFSACNELKIGFCLIVEIEFNKLIVSLSVMLLVVVEAADCQDSVHTISTIHNMSIVIHKQNPLV
jgi:hypothetical protein